MPLRRSRASVVRQCPSLPGVKRTHGPCGLYACCTRVCTVSPAQARWRQRRTTPISGHPPMTEPAMAQHPLAFAEARANMVDSQVRPNKVNDPRIVAAMRQLPRERFLPPGLAARAYIDQDVPLGSGRVLLEPMVIARLLQLTAIARRRARAGRRRRHRLRRGIAGRLRCQGHRVGGGRTAAGHRRRDPVRIRPERQPGHRPARGRLAGRRPLRCDPHRGCRSAPFRRPSATNSTRRPAVSSPSSPAPTSAAMPSSPRPPRWVFAPSQCSTAVLRPFRRCCRSRALCSDPPTVA